MRRDLRKIRGQIFTRIRPRPVERRGTEPSPRNQEVIFLFVRLNEDLALCIGCVRKLSARDLRINRSTFELNHLSRNITEEHCGWSASRTLRRYGLLHLRPILVRRKLTHLLWKLR